jgi:sialidase-1
VSSSDDGVTWSPPREITRDVKKPEWTWYATGPGHGIALKRGRLVVPCDHVVGRSRNYAESARSHVIHSDDGGKSWRIGGVVGPGTNECTVVERAGGALYLNARNYVLPRRRAFAWSRDGGVTFEARGWDKALIEPICHASVVGLPDPDGRVLFSNPASEKRERMTVRLSDGDLKSWPAARVLHSGPAAYSDLAVLPSGEIGCFYERGEKGPYEKITFARFNLEWLTAEATAPAPR